MLGGGDLAMLLKNTAAGQAVMKLLSDKNIGEDAAGKSNYLSPHKDFDVSKYSGQIGQEIAKITSGASVFLFDGSDQMPGAVGAGTFWKDMTSWIAGQQSLDKALSDIDSSWPTS
jgi:alpha-glucoside transport system substrate-binding protein